MRLGFGILIGNRRRTFIVMPARDRKIVTLGRWPTTHLKDARKAAFRILDGPTVPHHIATVCFFLQPVSLKMALFALTMEVP